jgi:hypothetical protein
MIRGHAFTAAARIIPLALLLLCVSIASAASKPRKRVTTANEPFTTFRKIDQVLTRIDADDREVNSEIANAEKETGRQRARTVNALRRSRKIRTLLNSSSSLVAITARGEALYSRRHQRYGSRLFRDLHAKAVRMRSSAVLESRATTFTDLKIERQRFTARLLPFVLQFQAISGGFAALRCDPGGWACCQPKVVKQTATISARGCTWVCATQIRACRYGCLGPRTPRTTAAENNIETRVPTERRR